MNDQQAKMLYAKWVERRHPQIYKVAVELSKKGHDIKSGLGEEQPKDKNWWDKLADNLTTVGTAAINLEAQRNILREQSRRANQGLAPLETSQFAPTVRVAGEVSTQSLENIKTSFGLGGIEKYIKPALLGIGVLFAIKKLR